MNQPEIKDDQVNPGMNLLQESNDASRYPADHPSSKAFPKRQTPSSPSETLNPTKRILLADDEGSVRLMLSRVLKAEGYEVAFATTGREAAAKFIADPPHLVLLDLNMPGTDGWEAFDLMCEKYPLVPIIVITARPNQYGRAIELGIDALMEKPLHLPRLLETIRNLLSETETESTRRLTNPEFKTAFLNPGGNDPLTGAHK